MPTDNNSKLDVLLRKAAAEKYGLGPIVEDVEKIRATADKIDSLVADMEAIKPVIEKVKIIKDTLKGDDGYSPVIGKDFLTEEDQTRLVDGLRPKKDTDYFDGAPGKDGADGRDGKDGVNGQDGKDGADGKDGKDGESVNIETVIEYIKTLKGKDAADFSKAVGGKIDISHVRNAQQFMFNGKKYGIEELMHGGGSSSGSSTNVVTQYDLQTKTQVGSDVVVPLSQLTNFATLTNVVAAYRNQIPQTNGITCTITATDVTFLNADVSEIFSITYVYN